MNNDMYKLIVNYIDEKHFGCKVIVFKGENNYFLIENGRDDIGYYIVDRTMTRIYPINATIKTKNISFDFDNIPPSIDFTLNVSKYGYSPCPQWIKLLLQKSN